MDKPDKLQFTSKHELTRTDFQWAYMCVFLHYRLCINKLDVVKIHNEKVNNGNFH